MPSRPAAPQPAVGHVPLGDARPPVVDGKAFFRLKDMWHTVGASQVGEITPAHRGRDLLEVHWKSTRSG